jgi:NTP pyrophosphatase (non-canonical NTP hydrolase)
MSREVPIVESIERAIHGSVAWLETAVGRDQASLTIRSLKIVEEAGEAAAAWIGATGTNPRKGTTHSLVDVADELADVAFTALVAIESLGFDHLSVLRRCADKVAERLPPMPRQANQKS